MRRAPFALALLGLVVAGASATPDDLSGCALITHYVPELQYSEDPGTLCQDYFMYAITSPEELITRIDTGGTLQLANWFILAAFPEDDKEWCGAQFGFDEFETGYSGIFEFFFSGPCFPPMGGLEIPSAGWPGPMEGTAFVVTGQPWTGNFVPVYFFGGYAYGYGDPGVMALIPDPSIAVPFGGLGNCLPVPMKYDAHLGGMGVDMDGIHVWPTHPERVCCIGEECQIITFELCMDAGGVWYEDLTSCEPNPCIIYGACCVGGNCSITNQSTCEQTGGEWIGEGTTCNPNPCPAVCCEAGFCSITLEDECSAAGGDWYPDLTSCDPNPCPAVCCIDSNCSIQLEGDCLAMGGTWHPDLTSCDPNPCIALGACCMDGNCWVMGQAGCEQGGGEWLGEGTVCDPNPCPAVCCVAGDCSIQLENICSAMGGTWHPDLTSCDPNPCPAYGACCVGGNCSFTSQSICEQGGGEWLGEGTVCDPNPCFAVCCVGSDCSIQLEDNCLAMGGLWHPDLTSCEPNPCAVLGVCCIGPDCSITTQWVCEQAGGDWFPEWTTCDPNPCVPTATPATSWGRIKALYR
ncbi:MAG: hypothetical protein KAY24_02365 [Candidatus Eisenbacteria sp.]|nr:hypothetical protein [Candidatus Eisenbacteria bacterium]